MSGLLSSCEETVGFTPGPRVEELRVGLMLPLLLLNRLPDLPPVTEAELENPLDELPKMGEDGATEAGVAIRVGVMSLLVMIATVVRVLDRLLVFGLLLVGLKRLGLMTGVNALRLGFVKEDDARDAGFLDEPRTELSDSAEDSDGFKLVERTNSVSRSSILMIELEANVGVLEPWSWLSTEGEINSPDSNSGAIVGATLFSNAFVEVGTISLFSFKVFVNSIEAKDVGRRLICSVKDAGRISVLVSSWLVMMVLSPSIDVVQ